MLTNSVTEKSQNKENEALELPTETKSNGNRHRHELSSSSIFFDDVNFVNKEDDEDEEEEEDPVLCNGCNTEFENQSNFINHLKLGTDCWKEHSKL